MILERRPTSEIKKAAREEGMRFLRECAVEQVLHRRDDAARDQQGDVRRMSQRTSSQPRGSPARRRRSRVEITATRVRRGGARRTTAAAAVVAGYASEPLPPGSATPALNAPNVHDEAALAAAIAACSSSSARRRRSRWSCRTRSRKVSLLRFEKMPAKAAGPRSADSLADAEGGAVPDRGRAGAWQPGVALPAAAASSSSPWRAAMSSESYERACDAAGVHAGIVDLASFNVINAVLGGAAARRRLAAGARRRGRRDARDRARRRRRCSSATAHAAATAISRISCTRPRCITRTGSAAAASAGRARRRGGARRRGSRAVPPAARGAPRR